ncbi:MAG: hypothetical protein H0T51_15465, partial [Pirellulales bacterium]|nr:hypothetical protein [Pirellulales bacterium]
HTTGVSILGGVATVTDNIVGASTGLSISGGAATLAGSTLTGNTTGVSVSGTGALTVGAGNAISGATTGMLLSGAGVGLTGLTFNNISIDATGDYITLANSAFDNQDLIATGTTLGGVAVGSMTNAQKFAATNKITDEIDNNSLGLVLLATNTIFVTPATTPTASDNDYTRIKNAIEAAGDNWTIDLQGTFDWTEFNANASWALGNDGVSGTGDDDYSILVAGGLEGVTLTASGGLGTATILGPGDLAGVNLEGFLYFPGGNNAGDENKNWTISNLEINDFDLGIGMFFSGAGVDAFDGTQIVNNRIRIATDLNATVAPIDVNQNIGIHYSFGANQTIQGNFIDIPGTGISDSANLRFASSVGMQSNTSGGAVYDGLLIDNNTITVLGAQSADPENILGIWENGHAHTSDITVSNNDFVSNAVGNNPAANLQRAFRVTSHSGASSTVTYSNNTVSGANTGFQWIAGSSFAGNLPVHVTGNTLTNVNTGFLIQSNGVANLSGNSLTNSGAMAGVGIGVDVAAGSVVAIDGSVNENTITGFATGIRSAGTLTVHGNDASIHGNAVGVDVTAGTAAISNNHIYDNTIGVRFATTGGGSLTNNNFDDAADNAADLVIAATAGAVTIGAGNDFAGDTFFIDNQSAQSYDLSGIGTTFDEANDYRIEDKVFHTVDAGNTSAGLVTWVANNVFVTAPGLGSTDSSIQRGVDAVPLLPGWTVNVEAGVYVENVSINKNLTLLSELGRASATIQGVSGVGALGAIVLTGSTTDVNIGGPAGNGFTIVGIDNGLPGIENAAVYFQGSHSGADVRFNEVVANGDAGLMTESGQTITNFNIDNNIFSGTTFVGTPADLGFSNQFTTPNVPRQLVVMGSGAGNTLMSNLQFTNNQITGTAGGINGALQEQGNTLVTVDGLNTTISGNTFSGTTNRFGHSMRARGANNTITDNVFNSATMGATTVDVYVNRTGNVIQGNTFTSSAGAAIHVDNLGGATIGGATPGDANSITGYASGILVTGAASAVIDSNSITGGTVGVNVFAGSTLVQSNTLTGNLVGIRVDGGAIVDAGSTALDGNPTGLGVSTGGNILTGYTGAGGNFAIEDLNLAAQSDVYAKFNNFGPYVNISIIEDYVFDDTDDPTRSMVLFTSALNQQPAPSVVYVDDSWAGTALGTDADGGGNIVANWTGIGGAANGTQFGVDQFATIQDAINAVAAGGSIYVYAGSYVQELAIDQALSLFGFQAGQNATTRGVVAESVIEASAASDALIEVNASNVTIDGFSVDGADDAFRAIRVNGVDFATVQNNIITGAVRGVQYNGAPTSNTGGLVTQNLVEDLTTGGPETYGVLAFDASYASVTNNVITSDVGAFEQYFYEPNAGNVANVISGNQFNAAQLGYGTNERASGASATALSGNTHNITGPGGVGVQLYNIYKTGGISLTNETIVGADVGVYAFVNGGSASITGGSIDGTDAPGSIGVHVTNYLTAFSYAATGNGDVTIDGVDISDFGVGVHLEDDALGAFTVHATVTNDTDITSSGTAILVSGADASVDVTNNDNSISGNAVGIDVNGGSATVTNNHIFDNGVGVQFRNGGTGSVNNNNFDDAADNDSDVLVQASAGTVTLGDGNDFAGDDYFIENLSTQDFNLFPLALTTYEGSVPGAFPDNFRIEDQMLHGPDNGTSGVITWVTG